MAGGELRRGLRKAYTLLIVIDRIERYEFKGVTSNIATYLNDVVKMRNTGPPTNTWSGFTFMLPLFSTPFTYLLRQILQHPSIFFSLLCGQCHYSTVLLESTEERVNSTLVC